MPAHDPAVASRSASIAALSRWAREDPRANAERGQQGLRDRFRREVLADDPQLTDEREIQRRADVLYRLHFKRMAFEREKARRLAREAAEAAGGT